MLKLATIEDFDAIKSLALAFFEASPYQPFGVSTNRVEELIYVFLDAKKTDKLLLLWSDPHPTGVLAAAAETNLFNYERMAGELMWYIDPRHRGLKVASKMLEAYEYWAAKIGCQFCTLVDLMGNLDKFYTRKGYERRETSYVKVL